MSLQCLTEIPGVPAAIGPYSPAVECGSLLFCSGQIPLDPKSGAIVQGGIEAQTRQVLENCKALLLGAGLDVTDIVKTTIFLTDLGTFQLVNGMYEEALRGHKPARSTVQVAALPKGAMIEIEMIASRR